MTATATTTELHLPAAEPFEFGASLRFVRSFPAMVGEQDVDDTALTVALRENGRVLAARLTAATERPGLACVLTGEAPVDDATRAAVGDRLAFRFGLADDVAELVAMAVDDPPFAAVVDRLRGYHQVKFPSPLELLCWAILCQRVPVPVARGMKSALVERFGNAVPGTDLLAFPDLQQLLTVELPELTDLIGNGRKAGYLHGSLRGFAEIGEEHLRAGPFDDVRDALLALPGIGPWSANFLLVRGLGRTERMAPDPEALRAASRVYGHEIDESEFGRLAARYGIWQGYWGHYLRVGG